MSKFKFITPYTIPIGHSNVGALCCADVSLTTQADKDDADINTIVKRFGLTGQLPYGVAVPVFDDYSQIPSDYQSALAYINDANSSFMTMPADVRSRFENDASKFLDFVYNPENYAEASALGLLTPEASAKAKAASETQDQQAAGAPAAQSST